MNIYSQELKMNIRSGFTWGLAMTILLLLFTALYPSMSGEMDAFNQIMEYYPPELRAAFGLDTMDFSSAVGFLGFAFTFLQFAISIQAANYGFSLVSIEERELTADFLLSKPVTRVKILTMKLLAALTCLGITNAIIWAATLIFTNIFDGGNPVNNSDLYLLLWTVTILQLYFLAVGLVISLFIRKIRNVNPLALGLVVFLFLVRPFAEDGLSILSFTPFKPLDPGPILIRGGYDTAQTLLIVGIIVLAVVVSYWRYPRRDFFTV